MICSALWWQDPPLQQRCYWRGMMAQPICCCMSKFLNRLIRRARFLLCPTIAIFLAKNPSTRCKNNFEGHVLDSYELRVCSEAHRVTSSNLESGGCTLIACSSWFRAFSGKELQKHWIRLIMTSFSKIWPSVGEGNGVIWCGQIQYWQLRLRRAKEQDGWIAAAEEAGDINLLIVLVGPGLCPCQCAVLKCLLSLRGSEAFPQLLLWRSGGCGECVSWTWPSEASDTWSFQVSTRCRESKLEKPSSEVKKGFKEVTSG